MNETLVAEIAKNTIPIQRATVHEGQSWLEVSIPNGWDDCKKLTKKVLVFGGKTHIWRSWNSDRNVCYFVESLDVAKIK